MSETVFYSLENREDFMNRIKDERISVCYFTTKVGKSDDVVAIGNIVAPMKKFTTVLKLSAAKVDEVVKQVIIHEEVIGSAIPTCDDDVKKYEKAIDGEIENFIKEIKRFYPACVLARGEVA